MMPRCHDPILLLTTVLAIGACQLPAAPPPATTRPGSPEATSLLGTPLHPPPLSPEARAKREDELAQARARYEQDPRSEDTIIWRGRRLAYLGRYRDAIAVYTEGLSLHPDSYKLLRHRGHRYLTLRRFDDAIADLQRAADLIHDVPDEVEPDGLPNARNIPTSTSHTNIYYHLGLAHYLKGELMPARLAYRRCLAFCKNDDIRCATTYWRYLTLRRLDRPARADELLEPIHADLEIIENFAYHKLLLLFKGELEPDQLLASEDADWIEDATLGYGIGAWHLINGRREKALEIFNRMVTGPGWPAFGHLAAEAELARQSQGP